MGRLFEGQRLHSNDPRPHSIGLGRWLSGLDSTGPRSHSPSAPCLKGVYQSITRIHLFFFPVYRTGLPTGDSACLVTIPRKCPSSQTLEFGCGRARELHGKSDGPGEQLSTFSASIDYKLNCF